MTSSAKRFTIRISIRYRCVPGKQEPVFAGLANLQNPPHKWHGFRIFAHTAPGAGVTRRSVVRIHSPLLFPKRPEMVVFGLTCVAILYFTVFDCILIIGWENLSSDRHVSRGRGGKCPVTHGAFVTDFAIYLYNDCFYCMNPVSTLIFNPWKRRFVKLWVEYGNFYSMTSTHSPHFAGLPRFRTHNL